LEGVGVVVRCCQGDSVGAHDGFDEEELPVVVGARLNIALRARRKSLCGASTIKLVGANLVLSL
jgi:hypothetical protein